MHTKKEGAQHSVHVVGAEEVNLTLASVVLHTFRCCIQIHKGLILSAYAAYVLFIWQRWWTRLSWCLRLMHSVAGRIHVCMLPKVH